MDANLKGVLFSNEGLRMATRLGLWLSVLLSGFLFAAGCSSDVPAEPIPRVYQPPPQLQATYVRPRPQYVYVPPRPVPHYYTPVPVRPRRPAGIFADIPASWIPPVPPRHWKWIIIHHTATSFGNAAIVTRWHIARGFDEMGYHFLIDNGNGGPDGRVEVGTRWPKQKWGAHTKTPDNQFNNYGIGICLVGNFDITHPTPAQLRSLTRLVAYLMLTYHISPDNVLGHNQCKPTDCPGRYMNVAAVRNAAVRMLVDAGYTQFAHEPARLAAGTELLRDVYPR